MEEKEPLLEVEFSELQLDISIYQSSLREFTRAAWEDIEQQTTYVHGWHIDAICEHLEAVTRGEIRNLLINMPPRHMKSILCSVAWPAWVWTTKPHTKWMFSSYGYVLSKRDSLKTRSLIQSHFYQKHFGHMFNLKSDQNEKMRFDNNKSGFRLSTSVGGATTGDGGDIIVCDDPHNVKDGESQQKRETTLMWWDQAMSTRGNNPNTFAKVIIMQRVHEKDLSGHVLAQGGYEHLCLPAEYEEKKCFTSIGWSDPRKEKGDLLWPDRFTKEFITDLKIRLGPSASQAQLQQSPKPSDGGLFKRHWWKIFDQPPQFKRICQFWDCAQKVGITNDYSVCATWGVSDTGYYLIDLWKGRVEAPQLEHAAIFNYNKHKPSVIYIEDKSSGSSLIQYLKQKTAYPVIAYDPKARDKEVRASAATPTVAAGRCFLPRGASWVEDFIREHEVFPNGEHDDQVDTTSMMVECLTNPERTVRITVI